MEIALRRREQEVWQACDDLWATFGDLKNLTGDAIRERLVMLGKSRGSPNEIYRYRKSWSQSRRVQDSPSVSSQEQDPITRVVRMVHEKLLSETDEKIDALKLEHDTNLQQKNRELEQSQANLAQVIHELKITSDALNKIQVEFENLKQQLVAEVEVRKAQERELSFTKNSHQQLIQEIKTAHHDACDKLERSYKLSVGEHLSHIERLEAEQKRLGFEFSEKLGEIKISNYNQALSIKNLQAELEQRAAYIEAQRTKLKATLEENSQLKIREELVRHELACLQNSYECSQKELSKAKIARKKHEVTIARLRVVRAMS